ARSVPAFLAREWQAGLAKTGFPRQLAVAAPPGCPWLGAAQCVFSCPAGQGRDGERLLALQPVPREGKMFKLLRTAVVLVGLGSTSWLVLQMLGIDSLDELKSRLGTTTNAVTPVQAPAAAPRDVIRIATFNIQVFGQEKIRKPH